MTRTATVSRASPPQSCRRSRQVGQSGEVEIGVYKEEITKMANTDDIVRDALINNLRQLKSERLAALSGRVDIQVAMQAFLHHEARRLEKKLGAQHPRVRQMKSRLKSNLQVINSLEVE